MHLSIMQIESTTVDEKDPPKEEKKKKRNSSHTEKELLESLTEGEAKGMRFSIIRCNLENALKGFEMKKRLLEDLDAEAVAQGLYRTAVGMIANFIIIRDLETGKHEVNKTFFDQIWSALDHANPRDKKKKRNDTKQGKKCKKSSVSSIAPEKHGRNAMTTLVEEYFAATAFDVRDLPHPLLFEMRSPTTRDMAVVALNHLIVGFEKRLLCYITYRVANLRSTHATSRKHVRTVARIISKLALKGICTIPNKMLEALSVHVNCDELVPILEECGGAIFPLLPTDSKISRDKSFRKNVHLLLPLLSRISNSFEDSQRRANAIRDKHRNETCKSTRRRLVMKEFHQQGLILCGKPFSLLPCWSLQPVFVDYAETQLESKFGKIFKKGTIMEYFEEHVFNLEQIKKGRKKGWAMSGFRTNGVELHIRYQALACRKPPIANTEALKKAGYQFPVPKRLVDVRKEEKGVYRITEKRYDNKKASPGDDMVLVVVDPGLANVITVRETHLRKSTSVDNILAHSKTWEVSNEEWKNMSKHGERQAWEKKRRQSDKRLYQEVLKELMETRRKTAKAETFLEYTKAFTKRFKVLARELSSKSRRIIRYQHAKHSHSAFAKLANRLMGKKSDTTKRIILYGDGRFRAMKGRPGAPTKSVVRHCATRGLTFSLGEHGSSKYCPCCGGEMKNVRGKHRIRSCTNGLNAAMPCYFSENQVDRDDCATISLTLCASMALLLKQRPMQYCRKAQQSNVLEEHLLDDD